MTVATAGRLRRRAAAPSLLWRLLSLWLHCEGVFFIASLVDRLYYGLRPRSGARPPHFPRFPRERRALLLRRILDEFKSPVDGNNAAAAAAELVVTPEGRARGRAWLRGWFGGCDWSVLRRETVREFFAWAWFDCYDSRDLSAADAREVDRLVAEAQKVVGELPPGSTPASEAVMQRQSVDPFFHRTASHPLAFYVVMSMMTRFAAPLVLRGALGFRRRRAGRINYWWHPGTGGGAGTAADEGHRCPILFWHGIGVGLAPYFWWLKSLLTLGRPMIVPEVPEAVLTLGSSAPFLRATSGRRPVSVDETLAAVDAMLVNHGATRFSLVGHSYGTFVSSWLIEARPECIESVVLVDPVSVMLHHADVCDKFLYNTKPCKSQMEMLMRYAVRQEPGVVRTLMRNFWWYKNTTWVADLGNRFRGRSGLVVASEDEYAAVDLMIREVQQMNRRQRRRACHGREEEGAEEDLCDAVALKVFQGARHGEVMVRQKMQDAILEMLRRRVAR